jgi:3-oxoacyl-[acyl-carrier protein] reductase
MPADAIRRAAIVTGGSRNIGRAVALELARVGHDLVVNSRSGGDALEATLAAARAAGAEAVGEPGDVVDPDLGRRLVARGEEAFGRVDVLVHVPAIRPVQPFLDTTRADWEQVLATNLGSLFTMCQAVLPGMVDRGWGRIVGFSGAKAFSGHRIGAHVAASKAGVVGLIRGLAYEFAGAGITANVIVPGPFETERAGGFEVGGRRFEAAGTPSGRSLPPVGRLGQPEEVGRLCAYLVSEDAGFLTGQSVHINGGVAFH